MEIYDQNEEGEWTVDYGRIDETEDIAPIQNLAKDQENLASEVEVNKANFGKFAAGKTQEVERMVESAMPQARGENLVAQLDSAVTQAEQLRDQQVEQEYNDGLGVYVKEKAEL